MKQRIVYSCPFVPAEWVAANGFVPARIVPEGQSGPAGPLPSREGLCPYARSFAADAATGPNAAAVVVTTVCDQMRRVADLIRLNTNTPVFVLNVPHTWQSPGAFRTYQSEVRRLGRFLERLGGRTPDLQRLRQTAFEFDLARGRLRDAIGLLSPRRWAETAAAFFAGESIDLPDGRAVLPRGVPLALVGGPITADLFALFEMVEHAGGWVALNASETGERTLPAPIDRRLLSKDPLTAICEAYFGTIPDAFRRPNSGLFEWLRRKIDERGVRGIVYHRFVWCDTWRAESRRVKEWARRTWPGIGFLELDSGDDGFEEARWLSRLQSFVEMLR